MENVRKFIKDKSSFVLVGLYLLLKIFLGMVQLPHYTKHSSEIPFLIITLVLVLLCIALKIVQHRQPLIRKLFHLQIEGFLIWVITIVYIIFSWSLCDALNWNLFQKVLVALIEGFQTFLITLFLDPKFITKVEFIGFQSVIASYIIALAIKTVGFIKDDSQSEHKDIVLLNLSTQIALAIILMDVIEKSYSKMRKSEIEEDMSRIQNQLVMTK